MLNIRLPSVLSFPPLLLLLTDRTRPIQESVSRISNAMAVVLTAWYSPPSTTTSERKLTLNQTWFWHHASDPGVRAGATYGGEPEEYDVTAEQPADLVILQMGGNDHRPPNEIPGDKFEEAYIEMIEDIHNVWPHADVVLMVCPFPQSNALTD